MIYDVLIIGGGPAGMMAAGRAGERGGRVLLLEKNKSLGKKLSLSGHARCNLSNDNADDKGVMSIYGKNFKFLYSAFSRFGVEKTLDFFRTLGLTTKTEDKGRIFPRSDRALDVVSALTNYLKENNVNIMFGTQVKRIVADGAEIQKIILADGKEIFARNFIIATGGKSYPGTGSTGDAYAWLEKLGHTIVCPRPALSALTVREKFVKELEGLSLKEVEIGVYQNRKKLLCQSGDVLFTGDGLSGPLIIDLSRRIGEIKPGTAFLKIDLFPGYTLEEFEKKIQNDFHHGNNKMFKNYLSALIPPKLFKTILDLTEIDGEKKINSISKPERKILVRLLKEFTFCVCGIKGFEKAMITAGGVDTGEVDPKTMRSRLFKNLYFAGEILDLDGPSGGYNLQICWSSGYVAGDSVVFG